VGSIRKAVGDIRHPAAQDDARVAVVTERSPASRPTSVERSGGSTMPSVSLHWHSTLLSAVAGYVDAAGFASLLGMFPAHLTGELVADAIAVSSGHVAAHTHVWAIPVFVGAVALATLVARIFRHHGLQARAGLLALVTLALALFSASDALSWLFDGAELPVIVRGGFAIAAMGFQSALMRESLTGSCPTTVMTGNLTQAVIEIVDQLVGKVTRPLLTEPTRTRRTPVARVFLVFMCSAALGGWLTRAYGSLSVTLPTLVTAALMVQALREDFARRAPAAAAAPVPAVEVTPTVEEAELWPDVFPASTRVKSAAEAVVCDPLREGSSGDCSSATRIKAAVARNGAPVPPQCRVSGIRRRLR
jgi:uncharacterized membrane protein YoaK (UPF0700 family)